MRSATRSAEHIYGVLATGSAFDSESFLPATLVESHPGRAWLRSGLLSLARPADQNDITSGGASAIQRPIFAFAAAPAPSISSVSPGSYPADTSNHTMKIFGSNFVSGDTLTFAPPEGGTINSNSSKLSFVSSTEIDYQFNDGNDPGSWSVRVNSPDGSQHSSYASFSVTVAVATPSISSVSPGTYPADTSNHIMKIFGSNFVSGDTLTFAPPEGGTINSSSSKLSFVSSTEIDYQFNDGNDAGSWSVRVNSSDGSQHSSYASFTVTVAAVTPSISSVSPGSYPADTSNHTMQIFGSNFVSGDTLTFTPPEGGTIGSTSSKLHFISSNEIDYDFNDGNDAGNWSVRVNSSDGSQHSSFASFTVTVAAATPSISSVSPNSYPADGVNHVMQIFGSNFASGDTLSFTPPEGGTIASTASKLHFVSSSEIDYDFNDGSDVGNWSVRVNSPDNSLHSSYTSFTVAVGAVTPSISSVSPTTYPADTVNHVMQIFGSNFASGDTLSFTPPEGGTIASTASKLHFISSTEIDYDFNDGSDVGNWSVRVNSADNSQHSSYTAFTVASSQPPATDQYTDNSSTTGILTTTVSSAIDAEPRAGSTQNLSDGQGGYVDKDWYQVTLARGQIYTFTGHATSITTGLMDISLYGTSGAQAHGAVEGSDPSFTFDTTNQVAATQTYYLAVSAGGPSPAWKAATGGYTVSLSGHTASAPTDTIPGSIQSTAVLHMDSTIQGTIDASDMGGGPDDDYYQVTLQGGSNYTFSASAGVSASDTLTSILIRLRDANGNILASGDKSSSGSDPSFDFLCPGIGSQTYFLAISASGTGWESQTGSYTIGFRDPPPPSITLGQINTNGHLTHGFDTNNILTLANADSVGAAASGTYGFALEYIGDHTGSLSKNPSIVDSLQRDASLSTVSIYENMNMSDKPVSGTVPWFDYFDPTLDGSGKSAAYYHGHADAESAFKYSSTPKGTPITSELFGLGQPFGSAIYFAMDFNPAAFTSDPSHRFSTEQQVLDSIRQYFQGIADYAAEFSASHGGNTYKIGVYGAGDTINEIKYGDHPLTSFG